MNNNVDQTEICRMRRDTASPWSLFAVEVPDPPAEPDLYSTCETVKQYEDRKDRARMQEKVLDPNYRPPPEVDALLDAEEDLDPTLLSSYLGRTYLPPVLQRYQNLPYFERGKEFERITNAREQKEKDAKNEEKRQQRIKDSNEREVQEQKLLEIYDQQDQVVQEREAQREGKGKARRLKHWY